MKVPIPSPAMAVALLALVVASTGTAVAAKAAMISGSDIKPHSITAKQLKKGAVDAKALRKGSVGSPALAPGSVGSSALAPGSVGPGNLQDLPLPGKIVPQTCPDGSVVLGTPCPVESYDELVGAPAANELAIPAAAGTLTYFQNSQGGFSLTPRWVMAPGAPTRVSRLEAGILSDPAAKWPTTVLVQLFVQGKPTAAFCTIVNPTAGGANSCSMASSGSIEIPARSRYTFAITISQVTGPDPGWDDLTVGFGYLSTQCDKADLRCISS